MIIKKRLNYIIISCIAIITFISIIIAFIYFKKRNTILKNEQTILQEIGINDLSKSSVHCNDNAIITKDDIDLTSTNPNNLIFSVETIVNSDNQELWDSLNVFLNDIDRLQYLLKPEVFKKHWEHYPKMEKVFSIIASKNNEKSENLLLSLLISPTYNFKTRKGARNNTLALNILIDVLENSNLSQSFLHRLQKITSENNSNNLFTSYITKRMIYRIFALSAEDIENTKYLLTKNSININVDLANDKFYHNILAEYRNRIEISKILVDQYFITEDKYNAEYILYLIFGELTPDSAIYYGIDPMLEYLPDINPKNPILRAEYVNLFRSLLSKKGKHSIPNNYIFIIKENISRLELPWSEMKPVSERDISLSPPKIP